MDDQGMTKGFADSKEVVLLSMSTIHKLCQKSKSKDNSVGSKLKSKNITEY